MKNILIFALFLTMNRLFSQSSGHENMPQTGFYAATLSQTQLDVFSRRASQKLQDFGAALQVIGNAEYPMQMREKSKLSALKMLENDKVFYNVKNYPLPRKNISIQDYLTYLLQNPQKMAVQDIQVSAAFHRTASELYTANYTFQWILGENKYPFSATLLLKKVWKTFGTEKKQVWEITISQIKEA